MTYSIPIIDFSDFSNRSAIIAQEVLEACETIGFFYMISHTIPKQQIDHAFELSKEFYDLSYEEKSKYKIQSNFHGYSGLYVQRLDPKNQKQGDHKETYDFLPFRKGESLNLLPEVFLENKDYLENFARTCHSTAIQVLQAFSIALKIPEEEGGTEWFSVRHRYDVPLSSELLRFLKYPKGAEETYNDPVRTGAHTDYGSITLLFQKDIPGLEVQASRTDWISAPIVKDAILVNVGGVMEYWTNGLFKSTLHRVVFLPEHQTHDRYSIAYFVQPEKDASLAAVPSSIIPEVRPVFEDAPKNDDQEMTVDDYLNMRYQQSYHPKN
ncbi:hypothetical protein BDA99DRAFT_522310 [Phascolomyces articulosus]|uniref:Fe2OG dioxygenase domain-containing protein n=1 Tax=Phascolomyces articulosus TaxID=60185 RepID=A0AAD5P9J5_9FUNG|nr:hypothetical protein BDA99DRAFT_522310 [Phascolomyces articulosus]